MKAFLRAALVLLAFGATGALYGALSDGLVNELQAEDQVPRGHTHIESDSTWYCHCSGTACKPCEDA
jgi:hypothetical protein